MTYKYPLASDTIDRKDIDNLIEWLDDMPRLTMGNLTRQFEQKWADFIGTKYSVYVNSGSSANLLMAYSLLNTGKLKHKKFLVPSCGWITTISPFIQFGIEPIMVDSNPINFGIDLNIVEDYLKKDIVDGFILVHVLGVPHNRKDILFLKDKYGCQVLEDCCQSVGAQYGNGEYLGVVGDMSSFSFYFGHQLSSIEGGFINLDDKLMYEQLLKLRSHGWVKDLPKDEYENDENYPFIFLEPGFNVRPTDLQAFIGLGQVDKAEEIFLKRSQNHIRYTQKMSNRFEFQDWKRAVPVSLHIGILAESKEHRKAVVDNCKQNGIETRIWSHGNLGRHPYWISRYGEFTGEIANKIYERGFIVPTHPDMDLEDIDIVAEVCNEA